MFSKIQNLIAFLIVSCLIGVVAFKVFDWVSPFSPSNFEKKLSQLVVDRNGRPLRAFADSQGVWRYPTALEKVSPLFIQALINYEDRQFWRHGGVNPLSMMRAVVQWAYYQKPISGGSTITMQVARILEPHSKSIFGKIKQIIRATQLEWHLSKKEILNLYLNLAPYGGPIEGLEAATYTYLGKSAEYLTHAEAALMAVLPQSPSRLRPDRFPERATQARNKVLIRMQRFGVWSKEKVDKAFEESIFATFNTRPMIAPLLARQLKNKNPDRTLIESTIDLDLQLMVADEVKEYLHRFSQQTSAAAMIMDNESLEVVAYVGAGDFGNQARFGHIDMNQAIRSPGSTLKPFIYGMALEEQLIHSASLLQDVPLTFNRYSPENFSNQFSGPVTVSKALQQSLNIPAVHLLNELGPIAFIAKLKNAGMNVYLPEGSAPSLSIALGGAGVKLVDLVGAYRALSKNGLAGEPRFSPSDPKIEKFLLSPESAWITAQILSEVPLLPRQKNPFLKKEKMWLAHKTGTSYGHRDAWMIATSLNYTIAVWIGKPDGTPSPGEFGRKTAAPLVSRLYRLLPKYLEVEDNIEKFAKLNPTRPKNVEQTSICWPLGLTAQLTQDAHCHESYFAWTINSVTPKTIFIGEKQGINPMPMSVDNRGNRVIPNCEVSEVSTKRVALWPIRLEHWLPNKFKRKVLVPSLAESCIQSRSLSNELIIVGIADGSTIRQPPNETRNLALNVSALGSQDGLEWMLNGEKVASSQSQSSVVLSKFKAGKNALMVFNEQGQMGSVEFEVR